MLYRTVAHGSYTAAQAGLDEQTSALQMLRHMVGRGLRMPTSVTSDGAPGFINAIKGVFGKAIRIRCWIHRLSNIRAKLPNEEVASRRNVLAALDVKIDIVNRKCFSVTGSLPLDGDEGVQPGTLAGAELPVTASGDASRPP